MTTKIICSNGHEETIDGTLGALRVCSTGDCDSVNLTGELQKTVGMKELKCETCLTVTEVLDTENPTDCPNTKRGVHVL